MKILLGDHHDILRVISGEAKDAELNRSEWFQSSSVGRGLGCSGVVMNTYVAMSAYALHTVQPLL